MSNPEREDASGSDTHPDGGERRQIDPDSGRTVRLGVPEMDCPTCAESLTGSVGSLDGVSLVDPNVPTGTVEVTYDPATVGLSAILDAIERSGYAVEDLDSGRTVRLGVPEMDCPSCAGSVESALERLDGVVTFETRVTQGVALVTYDPETVTESALVEAVENTGYEVVEVIDDGQRRDADATDSSAVWRSSRAQKTAISGVFLAVGLLLEWVLTDQNALLVTVLDSEVLVADALFLGSVAVAGHVILIDGYYSARNRSLDIDFLMTVAILSAIAASLVSPAARLYFEAATLTVLFSVAELLERYSMDQARDSLQELMELSPDEATVIRDGEEVTVPVADVHPGERVIVRPGEKIPTDGTVLEGHSAVNEAPITGESVPVDKEPGEEVYAGTVTEAGYLELEVTSATGEDTLSRIIDLVEDAQRNRTEREQFVDRFAGYYTPLMVTLAILIAAVPPLAFGAPWVVWFVNGITMLVLACPCAFVISTPVSVVSGITSAAKNGVLIKGGNHLEAMGEIDAVAFDKTGTLTKGELAVTDVIPVNGHSEDDVLRCARGLEERSEHPIGEAIVARADESAIDSASISGFQSLTGRGVRAELDGKLHYAGKPDLFADLGFDLEHVHVVAEREQLQAEMRDLCDQQGCLNLVEDTIPRLQSEGKTVVLVGRQERLEGVVAVADEVRPDARATVQRLRDLGIETIMLTGDNEGTARAIADQVGVDDYRAALLPEEKVAAVEELLAEYEDADGNRWIGRSGGVAMVGDGINDAPALASATVGIAMGAAGTDTALETADVALMGDDLSKLPYLTDLAQSANRVIRQNIWASLGVKALLAVGVPLGYVNVALAVLAGDAGMTVGVTSNAMRLARIAPVDLSLDSE